MPESWSAFDVIGPVMIGPSSSHTAGAAKIGYYAGILNGKLPKKARLLLHGSFAKVYHGHCTDKAIIGGLLGLLPHSEEIAKSDLLAKEKGMETEIIETNLGDTVHPNSVRIEMENSDGTSHQIRAKSIGGGKIVIREIDKVDCNLDMSYSCLIVIFDNLKTNALEVMEKVKDLKVKIIRFDTHQYKNRSMLNVEIRERFDSEIIHILEKMPGILLARFLNHLTNYEKYAK